MMTSNSAASLVCKTDRWGVTADRRIDEFETVRTKLESLFGSSQTKRKLVAALDEMVGIIKLARACGITRRMLFRPTLSRNAEVGDACDTLSGWL
jgi:hypothetical protein